jgi:trehalose 6-phosphate synthase
MKITFRLIISLLLGTALVVLIFSYIQMQREEKRLHEELRLRSAVLAKSFKEAIEPFLEYTEQPERVRKFVEKFQGHKRLIGIIVDLKEAERIALPPELAENGMFREETVRVIEQGQEVEVNSKWDKRDVYFYSVPLEKEELVVGALGLIHDRSFIVKRIGEVWKESAITFSVLAFILSGITLIIIRLSVTRPIARISELIRHASAGDDRHSGITREDKGDIEKLMLAVTHMASSLKAARIDLSEQSRLANAEGTIWTKERLKDYLAAKLEGRKLYVIANREPYIHRKKGNVVECITPASGVVTALDPVMQATSGMWIAHGAGDADRETANKQNQLAVPPSKPEYTLKRVWLSPEEEKGYYYGFSNEGLWPLCHISHVRPIFRMEDWLSYQKVNEKFANSLLEELDDDPPLILIQDYHFALLPKMIKDKRPDAKIALFWHIPWPNPEAFSICPWQEEILEGMLGADMIGFHTQFHCNNFLDTIDRGLESRIDWTTFGVTHSGKTSYVRPFPISVENFASASLPTETQSEELRKLRRSLGLEGKRIGIGVDRIDYTKGLLERFRAIERILEKYPQYQEQLVFVELGAPSRTLIPGYQQHLQEVDALVQKINARFQSNGYQPILFLKEHHDHKKIHDFYRLADFCLVSSLHDGMNLVAKEFVSARYDEKGVLILSRFAGASQEFSSALLINPYDIEGTADCIHQSLTMLPEEIRERMSKLRSIVREYNVYRWAAELITGLMKAF